MTDQLNAKELEVLHMLFEGETAADIARKTGISAETVSRWKKRPEFIDGMKQLAEDLREDLRPMLLRLSSRSLQALESDLRNWRSSTRSRTALSVLKLLGDGQFVTRCVPEEPPAPTPAS